FARPPRVQFRTQSDPRGDPRLTRPPDQNVQLVELLNDQHDTLPSLRPQERQVDKRFILEPVADQQRLRRALEGQRRIQLGFRPPFQPAGVFLAGPQELLDDSPPRIDLHGKNREMPAAILQFTRGLFVGAVQLLQLVFQKLRKAEQERRLQIPRAGEVVDDFL